MKILLRNVTANGYGKYEEKLEGNQMERNQIGELVKFAVFQPRNGHILNRYYLTFRVFLVYNLLLYYQVCLSFLLFPT